MTIRRVGKISLLKNGSTKFRGDGKIRLLGSPLPLYDIGVRIYDKNVKNLGDVQPIPVLFYVKRKEEK